MKYFMDCEFIEGFKKPIRWLPTIGNFNKPYHSIHLISIGIVCEDGREYYAIGNEFNPDDANEWVKENVLNKLLDRFELHDCGAIEAPIVKHDTWKSNKQIAKEIIDFVYPNYYLYAKSIPKEKIMNIIINKLESGKWVEDKYLIPEFYAYYADYDWVVFCSLFGTMMDLPKAFPMYCRDLKQMIDDICMSDKRWEGTCNGFEKRLALIKSWEDYPKQTNEHNALADAKWNFELFKFLKTLW